jgi:hypothetical protein
MAATGSPSVQGGLTWPQWKSNMSLGVNIVNEMSVGVVDYSVCAFWEPIDNFYLNFTSSSAIGASGNSSTGSGTATMNSAERGAEMGGWGLTMAAGVVVASLLMG